MMDCRITSDRLRTIEDVYREQWLVGEQIERQRCLLSYDREQIEEVLSPDYWVDILSMKAAGVIESTAAHIASRVRGTALGAGWISGWVDRLTRRLFRRRSPEQEYIYIIEEDDYEGV